MLTLNEDALRALMREQNMTSRDLSRKLGKEKDYISHAMSDQRNGRGIMPATARRIADGLGVHLQDITVYVRR